MKITGALVGFLLLAVGSGAAFIKAENAGSKTRDLAADSATQRVTTVKQRCKLTDLIIHGVTVKPGYKPQLEVSYQKCRAQLVKVEAIAKEFE